MRDLKTYVLEGFKLGKNKVDKDDDYVDLGLPSKTLWCKYNVGATCGNDVKSWYGDYFMWGDTKPATSKTCNFDNYKYSSGIYKLTKYCPTVKTAYWNGTGNPDDKSVLDLEDDTASVNMGDEWKMPTTEQLEELIDNTTSKWIKNYNDIQGLDGRLFESQVNSNNIFIPAAGCRHGSYVDHDGLDISIWSSSCGVVRPTYAYYLYSNRTSMYIMRNLRSYGCSVRGVMN